MMLAASSGWFQQFAAWAHTSVLNEPWFQNVLLVFSAAIAILTIGITSLLERRRATVDLVRDLQKDDLLIKARATIRSLKDGSGKIDVDSILAQKDSDAEIAILNVLNSFEFMAAGLRTKAFDEKTYKRLLYSTVVSQWFLFQEFVDKYRENDEKENKNENEDAQNLNASTLFQDFEMLATKWSKHPLKRIRPGWNLFKKKPVASIPQLPAQPQPPVQAHTPAPHRPIAPSPSPTPPPDGAST